jgi:hypothetical protein
MYHTASPLRRQPALTGGALRRYSRARYERRPRPGLGLIALLGLDGLRPARALDASRHRIRHRNRAKLPPRGLPLPAAHAPAAPPAGGRRAGIRPLRGLPAPIASGRRTAGAPPSSGGTVPGRPGRGDALRAGGTGPHAAGPGGSPRGRGHDLRCPPAPAGGPRRGNGCGCWGGQPEKGSRTPPFGAWPARPASSRAAPGGRVAPGLRLAAARPLRPPAGLRLPARRLCHNAELLREASPTPTPASPSSSSSSAPGIRRPSQGLGLWAPAGE